MEWWRMAAPEPPFGHPISAESVRPKFGRPLPCTSSAMPQQPPSPFLQNIEAELVTDILKRRLSVLGISTHNYNNILPIDPPDVLFHIAAPPGDDLPTPSPDSPVTLVRLLAHSSVLRQASHYFREILQHQEEEEEEVDDYDYDPDMAVASGTGPCTSATSAQDSSGASSFNYSMPSISSSASASEDEQDDASSSNIHDHSSTSRSSCSFSVASSSSSVLLPAPDPSCPPNAGEPTIIIRDMALHLPPSTEANHATVTDSSNSSCNRTSSSNSSGSSALIRETNDPCLKDIHTEASPPSTFDRSSNGGAAPVHAPRRSILMLPNTSSTPRDRKSLSARRGSMSSSARKSVRFSIAPVDIIPAAITKQGSQENPCAGDACDRAPNSDDGTTAMVDQSSSEKKDEESDAKDEEIGPIISTKPEEEGEKDKARIDYVEKPMIKRRYTEVNMAMMMMMDKKEQKNKTKKKKDGYGDGVPSHHFFVVKKHDWTAPVLIGILEWLYLGMVHINVLDIAALYRAAYRASLSSLTWSIRRHPIAHFFNLALSNYPTYLQSLLDLCLLADCAEFRSLHSFCQALLAVNGAPKIAILQTKSFPGRDTDFVREGFMVLDGHPICLLKTTKQREDDDDGDEDDDEDRGEVPDESGGGGGCEQPTSFLTFIEPAAQTSVSSNPSFQKMFRKIGNKSNKEQSWRVIMLDHDEAGSLHAFFNYVTKCNHISMAKRVGASLGMKKGQQEWFKFQMITRFKLGTILAKALRKGIREGLEIREERGCGAYIKGPSYCTSLVLEGLEPNKVLMAAKAIPYEMMGRCALEIMAPNLRTFSNLFHANHTFGLHLQHHTIVLVKPLYVIIKILEYITKLNTDAYEDPSIQRTFVELIEPTLHV